MKSVYLVIHSLQRMVILHCGRACSFLLNTLSWVLLAFHNMFRKGFGLLHFLSKAWKVVLITLQQKFENLIFKLYLPLTWCMICPQNAAQKMCEEKNGAPFPLYLWCIVQSDRRLVFSKDNITPLISSAALEQSVTITRLLLFIMMTVDCICKSFLLLRVVLELLWNFKILSRQASFTSIVKTGSVCCRLRAP